MNYKNLIIKTLFIALFIAISSCADDIPSDVIQGCIDTTALNYNENALVDNGTCVYVVTTNQEGIDNSTYPLELFQTGQEFPVSIGHNGVPNQTNLNSYRSTFTNLTDLNSLINPGTIFTKKVHNNNNGVIDTLQAFFGMIKREKGYWPEGGDFEYWMMPYNKAMVDTLQMPMGMLPANVDDKMRGKIVMCASCHSDQSSDGDFVFNYGPSAKMRITQEDVNKSTTALALYRTGEEFPVSIGHNGVPNQTNLNSYRSTFTNLTDLTAPITPGTIFTKKVHNNNNGTIDTLQAFFGMIKRKKGYWPEGGDFEYWMMPYNKAMVDTLQMPNGMIPTKVDNMMRGKIVMCASCHSDQSSDGDFVFDYGSSAQITVTQEKINEATKALAVNQTGQEFPVSIGHNGLPNQTNESSFRSTFTNLKDLTSPITPGTIFTKKVHNNNNGVVDTLQAFFGMIKREPGYWPDGGDYEYWMMPYNKGVIDTLQMPMGMLPANVDDKMRGKIVMCASCHSDQSSNGDFIFNYQ